MTAFKPGEVVVVTKGSAPGPHPFLAISSTIEPYDEVMSIYETDAGECFPDPQAAVADAKTASDMAKRELAYYEAARERHFGKR